MDFNIRMMCATDFGAAQWLLTTQPSQVVAELFPGVNPSMGIGTIEDCSGCCKTKYNPSPQKTWR